MYLVVHFGRTSAAHVRAVTFGRPLAPKGAQKGPTKMTKGALSLFMDHVKTCRFLTWPLNSEMVAFAYFLDTF